MRRIGLLGGTFDPPHIGHLLLAEEVRTELDLNEIWFIPTHVTPHKSVGTTAEHRTNMVELAVCNHPYLKTSLIEMERSGKSYTYDTIQLLKKQNPDAVFYFIIGGDMIQTLDSWYRIDELRKLVKFIGVSRSAYPKMTDTMVQVLEIPLFDLSSTEIRSRVKRLLPIQYYVTDEVAAYIKEHKLYEL